MRASAPVVAIVSMSAAGFVPIAAEPQSASVAGIVVSAGVAPAPIRRAIVTLSGGDTADLAAITGDNGRFEFRDVPPGVFNVVARKPAYLTMAYGATAPGRQGTPVAVAAGARIDDVRIVLPRGAVITGAVRDATGLPAVGVTVTAARAGGIEGVTRFATDGFTATTDDRGVYRVFGLPPGRYIVGMTPHRSVRGVHRMTAAAVDAELRALEARRFGRAMPRQPVESAQPQVYAPIFYPGTPMPGEATPIELTAAETSDGIDFVADVLPTSIVDGTVSAADGSPLGDVRLSLLQSGPPLPMFNFATSSSQPGPDGRFEFQNVVPGRYALLARRTSPAPAWGLAELTVRGEARRALALVLRSVIALSGRIVFDSERQAAPENLAAVSVGLRSPGAVGASITLPDGTVMTGVTAPPPASVRADGTFRIEGILPGVYVPVSSVPGLDGPGGWWLRSAVLGSRDLLDQPLELGADSSDIAGLVLTFTDRRSALMGWLTTPEGAPATDFVVVVLPADRGFWQPDSRRIRFARPATDGTYTFTNLPAGAYLIAALTDLDPVDLGDVAFLEQLVPLAVPVDVRDGATTTQNLAVRR